MSNGTDAPTTVDQQLGRESSLSNWAGDYTTDMLGRGWALADKPYDAYMGPLTAGPSELQTQAFGGISGLGLPEGYDPTTYTTGSFTDPGVAETYMNPYIKLALDPQLEELRRQSEIERLGINDKYTKARAYGGSRQAIAESELADNMLRQMMELTGAGYRDAYNTASDLYGREQDRDLKVQELTDRSAYNAANQGIASLNAERNILADQLAAGETQRGITSEGIAADYDQFAEERAYPYRQVQYMQGLLSGLPIQAQNFQYSEPGFLNLLGESTGGILAILRDLFGGGGSSGGGEESSGGGEGNIQVSGN